MMKSSASAPSRTTRMSLARWLALSACSVSSTSLGLSSTRRISTGLGSCMISLQAQVESGPGVDSAFGPHLASVALDNALDKCQSDACARKVLYAVKPLEYTE